MAGEEAFIARAFAPAGAADAADRLLADLGPGPFALVLLFLSPSADLAGIAGVMAARIAPGRLVGCTTAGEISDAGYDEGCVVALGFPASHFAAQTLVLPDLGRISRPAVAEAFLQARQTLATEHAHLPEELSILLVDGLSVKEDELAAALATGGGAIPMIGGSAGDGTRFQETLVLHGDRPLRNAAVLTVLRSACPVRTINMDHLEPTDRRMVVTDADPALRIVRRINAEPAAREYARLLGLAPGQIDTFTFAAHPLAVQMGARHHVRAIQRIMPSGDLVFFSAIDEGVVLTMTEPRDLTGHLERELARLETPAKPLAVLAFDCILRRLEAQESQMTGQVSSLLRRHGVVGFSTYGEQIGPMHVNHTMTGYAFYPPGTIIPEQAE